KDIKRRKPVLVLPLNGSSRSKSSNYSSRSIAELFVDYVKERLACDETLQVLGEDRQKRRPLFFREAADSWANDNIRQAPELRIFRQRLARERVQRRAGDPVFFQCSLQKSFLYRLATRQVDQIGTFLHR